MPLLKRKSFSLAEPPKDLDPNELVYQVRFTKEIFRDYPDYLSRINLYRHRVWTCKVSGKTNFTYEEALVSEKLATQKVLQFPKQLLPPALQIIQYSMLSLKDLADTIAENLQHHIFVGAELYARKDGIEFVCRILKVLQEGDSARYKVARLDRNKKVIDTSSLNKEDLLQKKVPYSRGVFKSFIRESTYRSAPWVLHEKLAQKHGISTHPPPDLRDKVFLQNGLLICSKKRKKNDQGMNSDMEIQDTSSEHREDDQTDKEPIRYPIDDLLVQPDADDPVFTVRPVPSRDFNVPMECVGDLLMVWDFCSSFGRMLQLSPYSLVDFESAICHDKSNVVLLVETHSSLFHLLMKSNDEYFLAVQKRNRNSKISLVTWTEYLCDMLVVVKISDSGSHISTIRRGHYGLLDARVKLGILRELVNCALETGIVREKLDEVIEQRHAIGSTVRVEAIEEARKKREVKEQSKAESVGNVVMESTNSAEDGYDKKLKESKDTEDDAMGKKESKKSDTLSKKKNPAENGETSWRNEALKQSAKEKEGSGRSKEQRKEYYEREMEKCFVRRSWLGKDRDYNRYWWFGHRDGRIFVESRESKEWGYYKTMEEVDALIGSLNCKGERERELKGQLEKFYTRIRSVMEKKRSKECKLTAMEEVRRSSRVRAPPRQNPAKAFLNYVNNWKEE